MSQDNNNKGAGGPMDFMSALFSSASGDNEDKNQGSSETSSSHTGGGNWGGGGKQKGVKITPESVDRVGKILDPNQSSEEALKPLVSDFLSTFGVTDEDSITKGAQFLAKLLGENADALSKYHAAAKGLLKSLGLDKPFDGGMPGGGRGDGGKGFGRGDNENNGGWSSNNKKVASNDRNNQEEEDQESGGGGRLI